jgi:hypothetical protein
MQICRSIPHRIQLKTKESLCCVDNSIYRLIQTGIYYESMTLNRNSVTQLLAEVSHNEVQEIMWNSLCQVHKNPWLKDFIR